MTGFNLWAAVDERISERQREVRPFLAVVTGTESGTHGTNVFIRRLTTDTPDPSSYPKLASYESPTEGDIVIVVDMGAGDSNQLVVLGALG